MLVLSFAALGVLWKEPRLDDADGGRRLRPSLQRVLLSRALRIALGLISVVLFGVVWAAAAFGAESSIENLAPTFVYVVFWLGMLPLVVLLGNVWTVLSPWKAIADAVAWGAARLGVRREPRPYPERFGRRPAVVLLLAFVTLELVYVDPADPRALAVAIAVYSLVTWSGMWVFGREPWFANGDGFNGYFGLLSRLSAFATREREGRREIVVRRPLSGLTIRDAQPGTVALVAVMLGSVAFDGFGRASWWQERLFSIQEAVAGSGQTVFDGATMGFNLLGLVGTVLVAGAVYVVAVGGAQLVAGRDVSFRGVFICSMIPIALVYAVAHYLTFFVVQGQFAIPLLSDPLGRGWDLFGTKDFRPKLDVFTPNQTWYIQVGALVTGHVIALVVAHDRAVALVRSARVAARTQYAMLALMILYTVGGMWLLTLT